MRVRDLGVLEIGDGDVERWKRLSDRALEANPFADPRFVLPSARHHFMGAGQRVVFVEDDDELHLALLYTVQRVKVGRFTVKAVTTAETIAAFEGERFHPLVSPTDPVRAAGALLSSLAGVTGQGVLELQRLPSGGILAEAFATASDRLGLPHLDTETRDFVAFDSSTKDLPPASGVEIRAEHLSTRTRKGHRRRLSALTREVGDDLAFVDIVDSPDAIDQYLALQSAGWKGDAAQDGKAFELTELDTWFRAVASEFRGDGRLAVYRLGTPSETVFMTVVLRAGTGAFGFHDAYNEAYAKLGPGAIGRLLEMELASTTGGSTYFDPSMDDTKYPTSVGLYPDARPYRSMLVGLRALPRMLVAAEARRRGRRSD